MREWGEEGSVSLVGRDHELRQVHDLIAGIGERGASLLVVGEAGIGKSSILAEANRLRSRALG